MLIQRGPRELLMLACVCPLDIVFYFDFTDNISYDVEDIFTLHMFLGTSVGCFLVSSSVG